MLCKNTLIFFDGLQKKFGSCEWLEIMCVSIISRERVSKAAALCSLQENIIALYMTVGLLKRSSILQLYCLLECKSNLIDGVAGGFVFFSVVEKLCEPASSQYSTWKSLE